MNYKTYQNPLIVRYCSKEMSYIFSPEFRYRTWRKLWVVLAREERRLGVPITEEQILSLERYCDDVNYDLALEYEKLTKHEVMGHIHAYGDQCPIAKGIIHLGATSAYVMDNSDLVQLKEGLVLLERRLVGLISELKDFCLRYKDLPTLGFTHFQVAQPTTVGKRGSLWLQDLVYDYNELKFRVEGLPFRGAKGTTGSQNSFLKLFEGDRAKVKELDERITEQMGFEKRAKLTGQTYSRKWDYFILGVLSGIAQSAYKFSNDIRLLQNMGELEEPFDSEQVGSSAMPYKRNPMRSERIASLSRYVISLLQNPAFTSASQWLERTLDDSANKRLSIPEAFLCVDSILILYHNVVRGLSVNEKVIERHLADELPFMITEDLLMAAVRRGFDRQGVHEAIRKLAIESVKRMKERSEANPFVSLLAASEDIPFTEGEIVDFLKVDDFIGLSVEQVVDFVREEVSGIIDRDLSIESTSYEVSV